MNHLGKFVIIGAVLAAGPVLAQGRGGGGGNAGAGANMGGQSGMNARAGGQSDANISAQGNANTNGPNAADRDFGQDRAASRATEGGASRAAEARARASTNTNAQQQAANQLGGLNAARASENAQANAAAGSRVGEVATYETRMRTAMAITDPARRDAAITDARRQLAQTSNKTLTADAIAQLDSTLNIQGASPQLGAAR